MKLKPILLNRIILALFLLTAATWQAAASPIYQIGGGTLTITGLFVGADPPILDIRGAVLLQVSDTGLPLSPLAIYDSTGGTDPDALMLPFGNSLLFADDENSGVSGITAVVQFNFALSQVSGPYITIPGTVTLIPIGSPLSGALGAFAGDSPVPFTFLNSAFADLGGGTFVLQWQLDSVGSPIPEPGSFALLSAGVVFLGIVHRKRSSFN